MRNLSPRARWAGLLALMLALAACTGSQPAPRETTPADPEKTPPATTLQVPPPPKPILPATRTASVRSADTPSFMFEDIYFKRGSTHLGTDASQLLDKKAQWLRDHPGAVVVIEGHTDYMASKEYNLALGDRRAGAVKSYLIRRGIARERLVAISFGKERPAVAGISEKDRAKNRRVHFVVE